MARRLGGWADPFNFRMGARSVPFRRQRSRHQPHHKIHQQRLHSSCDRGIHASNRRNGAPHVSFVGVHRAELGRRRCWCLDRWRIDLVVASTPAQRLPRPNLNRQLQLTVLRRGHHRRVQRSQRMRRINAPWLRPEDLRPVEPLRSIVQTALLLLLRHLR